VLADAPQAHALHAVLGPLEQEVELVGSQLRLREAGLTTELGDAVVLAAPVLVDEPAGRVIGLGELGQRVLDR
jgi:hypothetical protein